MLHATGYMLQGTCYRVHDTGYMIHEDDTWRWSWWFIYNRSCLSVWHQNAYFPYSKVFVVSPVCRHFPYSRYLVISPVYRHFPYLKVSRNSKTTKSLQIMTFQGILLFLLFLDTFCIQDIWSFLLFIDTFRILKCLETIKRQNPLK